MPTTDLEILTEAANAAAVEFERQPLSDRALMLQHVAAQLDAQVDSLVRLAAEETALEHDRLVGELARTTMQLRLFADVVSEGAFLEAAIDHADATTKPPRPDLRRVLVPLGPVAVFAAGNFPFAFSVAGGDTAAALAAGCPVIVKMHPGHPRTSRQTAEIVHAALDAHAPEGGFGLAEGFQTGIDLVGHAAIRAVAFTGSLHGGRSLFDVATSRPDPIPFYGELGSINPVIITPEAAAERADELAKGLLTSALLGVGQFCTQPGVVLVPQEGGIEAAVARAFGEPTPRPMLHDGIAAAFQEGIQRLVALDGIDFVAGDPAHVVAGRDARPVILAADATSVMKRPQEAFRECFGPTTLLVRYSSTEELQHLMSHLPGSLTVSLHQVTNGDATAEAIADRLHRLAGRVVYDGWPTGVTVAHAQHHGGPWPATTDPLHTSVGPASIRRFLRPVAYQDAPEDYLPPALRGGNPLGIARRIDGTLVLPSAR